MCTARPPLSLCSSGHAVYTFSLLGTLGTALAASEPVAACEPVEAEALGAAVDMGALSACTPCGELLLDELLAAAVGVLLVASARGEYSEASMAKRPPKAGAGAAAAPCALLPAVCTLPMSGSREKRDTNW